MTMQGDARPSTGATAAHNDALRAHLPDLETNRLVLHAPDLRDLPEWIRIFAADKAGHIGGPMSTEQAWHGFTGYVAGWLLHGHGMFSVVRKDTNALVGFVTVGLEFDDYEPELGWLFTESGRGCGFATEAAGAARDYAKQMLGAGAFVSYIDSANDASRRVAQRLGANRDALAEKVAADDGDPVEVWRHAT